MMIILYRLQLCFFTSQDLGLRPNASQGPTANILHIVFNVLLARHETPRQAHRPKQQIACTAQC